MSEQTTIPEPATVTPSPSTQDPLPMLLARIESLEADLRGRTGLPGASLTLLARIEALEADVAQSKAKVQEALAKLLAEPPTL